jgi:hypothetical protein
VKQERQQKGKPGKHIEPSPVAVVVVATGALTVMLNRTFQQLTRAFGHFDFAGDVHGTSFTKHQDFAVLPTQRFKTLPQGQRELTTGQGLGQIEVDEWPWW